MFAKAKARHHQVLIISHMVGLYSDINQYLCMPSSLEVYLVDKIESLEVLANNEAKAVELSRCKAAGRAHKMRLD